MPRILHLGLGAFHRAHQAAYLQALHDLGDREWQLAAGNLRADQPEVEAALLAQHGAYTLETVTPAGECSYQRIEAITTVLPHEPGLAELISLGAEADTAIVSFTVTEAGYEDPVNNLLFATLAKILEQRRSQGAGSVTLLSCDNLRHNGERTRDGLLLHLRSREDPALLAWAEANTSCPSSMVDRITPRPPVGLGSRVTAATGRADAAPLMAEQFSQWVIEDDFISGRPDWQRVGVELVRSVAPFEEAKIRILNATHSCIAWAGTLLGYRYIHEAVADPRIERIAAAYITDDVLPCLQPSPLDLAAYRDTVLHRFRNAALGDTCQRVVADGFAKLPGFIAPTIRERLKRGESTASVAMLPALFLAFLQRWHAGSLRDPYQDQAMDPARAHAICASTDPVLAFCDERALWADLAGDSRLATGVRAARRRVVRELAL